MIKSVSNQSYSDTGEIQRRTRRLPGSFTVGIRHYHVVDEARKDKQDRRLRQFMISAFYPAEGCSESSRARFLDIFEPFVEPALEYLLHGLSEDNARRLMQNLRAVGLQAYRGAPVHQSGTPPYPTLIYYPAGGGNRFGNVDVCEGLASQGYVVLAVDGPHDAPLVVFPDGFLCKGPLKGDYISPGVADVGRLIAGLDELNEDLVGVMDTNRIVVFGHSRGGYIANIVAFKHANVVAAVSIDSFLWGYSSTGTGLERHPPAFQSVVRSTPKSILRLCGRPAGSDPDAEAAYCLNRDGGDFVGEFSVVTLPGWGHSDFMTTPWLSGRSEALFSNQLRRVSTEGEILTGILGAFFDSTLAGAGASKLENYVRANPELGFAAKLSRQGLHEADR